MNYPTKYIDHIYTFKGFLDMTSKCGIKIVEKSHQTIVILSEIYRDNPGSSITETFSKTANAVVNDYAIDPREVIFIHHTPDMGSKFEFYQQVFDQVKLEIKDNQLTNPKWNRISQEEVDQMLGS